MSFHCLANQRLHTIDPTAPPSNKKIPPPMQKKKIQNPAALRGFILHKNDTLFNQLKL